MKIGLIGLPLSGKTTIFNALSKSNVKTSTFSSTKCSPNISVIDVKDWRVTKLSEIYKPKKTTYAKIELVDFAGVKKEENNADLFEPEIMRLVKTVDCLAIVLKNFPLSENDTTNPLTDLIKIEDELIISDQIVAENRIKKIKSLGKASKNQSNVLEDKILNRIIEYLNNSKPIRSINFTTEELKIIKGFQFLTLKPAFIILNSSEDKYKKNKDILEELEKKYSTIEFSGKFEMELSSLDESEKQDFMKDAGIEKSAADILTICAYKTCGMISFFTVGEDEVRAWEIKNGSNAVEAAGAIHSDLARGFIRAECFSYDDLISAGSEKVLKENGKIRMEGKDYIVKDGDILSIRFNI